MKIIIINNDNNNRKNYKKNYNALGTIKIMMTTTSRLPVNFQSGVRGRINFAISKQYQS
jgi:hypothetical protein